MGLLARSGGSARIALAAHMLVGRSPACALRVDDPLASGEHARVSWGGQGWSVRDLGSRNGTWVDGARMDPGAVRALAAGARLAFGNPAAPWILEDASPPVALARRLDDDHLIAAEGGLLALPSPESPAVCVLELTGAGWVVEAQGQGRQASDGEVLLVAGEPYMLHLPVVDSSTVDVARRPLGLGDVDVQIRVSHDEERVEVTVVGPSGTTVLPPRAHHYTLLTVARARLSADAGEPQGGWLSVDELCRALAMDEGRLAVDIYRIRQDFAALGLTGAASVIERRRGSRQVRLAAPRVSIAPMP